METPDTAAPVADEPIPPLRDEIRRACADPGQFPTADNSKGDRSLVQWQADAVMDLLTQRGHVLPGCPPAATILSDARSFAERLVMSNLAARLLNMLAWSEIETPETKPARQWLDDYFEGKNHGPIGCPMIWPLRMPGICALLRQWGYQPTQTMPPMVARAVPNPLASAPAPGTDQ